MSGSNLSFLQADANAESGGNSLIGYHNPAVSSAAGAYGITDPTWTGLMKTRPDLGLSWNNRLDPTANKAAAMALQDEWSNNLRSKNLPVDNGTLGLSSLYGPTAASALLQSDPNAPLAVVLSQSVGRDQAARMIQANPSLMGGTMSVGDALKANQQRMGAAVGAPQAGPSMPQMPSAPATGPIQPTPLPQMPPDFGQPSAPLPAAPTVDQSGHSGDGLLALGMGLASGRDWHEGMANGLKGYQAATAQQFENARKDADLQSTNNQQQDDAPYKAAVAANQRAEAWKALNQNISPDQALNANIQVRGQDNQIQLAAQRLAYEMQQPKGAAQQFIVPGSDGSPASTVEVSRDGMGRPVMQDLNTGTRLDKLPDGAIPIASYNQQTAQGAKLDASSAKDSNAIMSAGTSADNQIENLKRIQEDAAKPGALNGPGVAAKLGRAIDNFAGTSLFGNKTDEDISKMDLGQVNFASVKASMQGAGRLTQQEVGLLQNNFASVNTDPVARATVLGVLQHSLQRQSDIAKEWSNLDPTLKASIRRSPGGIQEWEYGENKKLIDSNPYTPPQPSTPAISASTAGNPSLSVPPPASGLSAAPTPAGGTSPGGFKYTFTPG